MSLLHRTFIAHPEAIGESYGEHARTAGMFGVKMISGGVRCLVHAVVPALFVDAASKTVVGLYGYMTRRAAARGLQAGAKDADSFSWVI